MKTIVLSNYPERELARIRAERQANDRRIEIEHSDLIQEYRTVRARARRDFGQALAAGQPLQLLRHGFRLVGHTTVPIPTRLPSTAPSDRERRFRAGVRGEKRVLRALQEALDDTWTALVGYRANGGDVDIMLVGVSGIYAIEVKHFNAVVNCDEDLWWDSKRGEFRLLESDASRLSPSQQLNGNLRTLKNYLTKSDSYSDIKTLVILSHRQSQIGQIKDSTVDLITTLRDWKVSAWFSTCPAKGTPYRSDTMVRRIRSSHRKWNSDENKNLPIAMPDNPTAVAVRMPDAVFEKFEMAKLERRGKPLEPIRRPSIYPYVRKADMDERNRWIWEAGAFDHLTDKNALINRSCAFKARAIGGRRVRAAAALGAIALLGLFISGCQAPGAKIDQQNVCVFSDDDSANACTEGQLAWFAPNSWGNEQLPLMVVASYCDIRHQVVQNTSGVVCVFTNRKN